MNAVEMTNEERHQMYREQAATGTLPGPKKASGSTKGLIVLGVIGVIVMIGALAPDEDVAKAPAEPKTTQTDRTEAAIGEFTPKSRPAPAAAPAKFKASFYRVSVVTPDRIQFYGRVKNVGSSKGKASCAVKAYDSSGTSIGGGMWDIWTTKVLKPKGWSYLIGVLDVDPGSALYVDSVKADCDI